MNKNIKKPKITIIDDEKDLVETLKSFLEDRNFSVSAAYGGLDGLEVIKKEKPDIVILDVMMPDMDGRDVLVELRKNEDTKKIPIIMLTIRSEPFDIDYGMQLGADAYLPKPYTASALLKHIKTILKK
ncbi:MAG: response regulator [Candidatus Omnitrophica bacterium]|nr:response regulator [Candidatus Omnitrophota bacterium]